jgi:hypothetical protein
MITHALTLVSQEHSAGRHYPRRDTPIARRRAQHIEAIICVTEERRCIVGRLVQSVTGAGSLNGPGADRT